jgi:KDO2-lipid IV(A) lauroyltransferase
MILYYLFRVIEFLLFLFPYTWRKRFFLLLAKIAYTIDSKHRRVILQNLHFALGRDFDEEKISQVSQYCYVNLLLAFHQVMENHHPNSQELEKEITLENRHFVDDALKANRRIIFVSAHFGNWELGATALSRLVTPTTAVYKEAKNPYFEKYLLESRTRQGITMVEKRGAVRHLSKALKNHHTISLLVDQNTNKKDGIIVSFFSQDARQSAASSFLARKYDAILV